MFPKLLIIAAFVVAASAAGSTISTATELGYASGAVGLGLADNYGLIRSARLFRDGITYPGSSYTYPESSYTYPGSSYTYPASSYTYPGSSYTYPGNGYTYPGNGYTYPSNIYSNGGYTYPGDYLNSFRNPYNAGYGWLNGYRQILKQTAIPY